MGKKFVDLANLKSNLENFLSEIISPTFATKEGVSKQLGNHTVKSDVPENAVFTDTTYSEATQSASGLMSAEDKKKLDGTPTFTLDGTTLTITTNS